MTNSPYYLNPHSGKTAVIMSRVSSDEQAKKYSLGAQEEALLRYCNANNVTVKRVIREDHSAKNFDRPEFQKLLKELKAKNHAIDLLLFITWDRFSRNSTDSFEMIKILKSYGVTSAAIDQPLDLSVPENKVMLAMYLTIPEIENDRRSIKIKSGIYAARKQGRWVGKAPYGYKNVRNENNVPIIIPDKNATAIRFAFEEAIKGSPQSQIRSQLAKRYKLDVSKTRLSKLLRSEIYTGLIPIPSFDNQKEQLIKGIHEPIVSLREFQKAQEILNASVTKRGIWKPKAIKEDLQLRGILQCENCGEHITGSASRSKTGQQHYYYHCNHCKQVRYPAEKVHQWLEETLCEIQFNLGIESLFDEIKKEVFSESGDFQGSNNEIATHQNEKARLEKKQQQLQEQYIQDKIDIEQFTRIDTGLKEAVRAINIIIAGIHDSNSNQTERETQIREAMEKILNLQRLYSEAPITERIKLLSSIFPEKLIFSKSKSRTQKINAVIELMLLKDKDLEQKKSGHFPDNLKVSRLVAHTGIEPLSFFYHPYNEYKFSFLIFANPYPSENSSFPKRLSGSPDKKIHYPL